jgi:hypothetical protein
MKSINWPRMLYLAAFTILAIPIVWAAFWYNKAAFDVWNAAALQGSLSLFPMMLIGYRAYLPRANSVAMILFFCLMAPLVVLSYTERAYTGWLYCLLELPVIWLFAIYAFVSIIKTTTSQARNP